MRFDNTYSRLPDHFFERINPTPVKSPRLIRLNTGLAADMELDLPDSTEDQAALFSGNVLFSGAQPIAQAYAGHQFGHFVPQLGDGRAVLLGEIVNSQGQRYDMQLKGSGVTSFSRNGDGRAPLGPIIREYIVSEAMHAYGIPTSRALAMVETGETVHRETPLPGGIITRVAASHIRVGTFEFFAARSDEDAIRLLADFVIDRHYPDCRNADNPYIELFRRVVQAQVKLVTHWLSIGFIHGVMNTDNTTISGETIDYGPCAFMDAYSPGQVFSSIDMQGRYAYNNQSTIAQWNMACLGGCLLPLFHEDQAEARALGEAVLEEFPERFKAEYMEIMCRKIGITEPNEEHFAHLKALLQFMHADHADFTLTFRHLAEVAMGNEEPFLALFTSTEAISAWLADWLPRLKEPNQAAQAMQAINPAFIPRNHRIEQAIRAAEDEHDFAPTHQLIDILKRPYVEQPEHAGYMLPPKPEEQVHQTFCGT